MHYITNQKKSKYVSVKFSQKAKNIQKWVKLGWGYKIWLRIGQIQDIVLKNKLWYNDRTKIWLKEV